MYLQVSNMCYTHMYKLKMNDSKFTEAVKLTF